MAMLRPTASKGYLLGVSDLEEVTSSRRCLGAAKPDVPKDRRQASPWTVEQLRAYTANWTIPQRTSGIECLRELSLCVVYSRSRWSDVQHACR